MAPVIGFPEKFELALRYGESQITKDAELSDSATLKGGSLSLV